MIHNNAGEKKRPNICHVPACSISDEGGCQETFSFPWVCCKSNYEEYNNSSQTLLGPLLQYMAHLQHGLSKEFTWEKSKALNRDYMKGSIRGLRVMVLTVAATTNQTWNQSLLWSITCWPQHSKFKTHYHELPSGLHLHRTLNPQQPAQLKMKIENPNTTSTVYTLATGKTQWKPDKKEVNTELSYVRNVAERECPQRWFSSNCICQELAFKS